MLVDSWISEFIWRGRDQDQRSTCELLAQGNSTCKSQVEHNKLRDCLRESDEGLR